MNLPLAVFCGQTEKKLRQFDKEHSGLVRTESEWQQLFLVWLAKQFSGRDV